MTLGQGGDPFATFCAIADSDRYSHPVLEKLSRFVTARLGGNRDEPIYRLCQLAVGLEALGFDRMSFLMGQRYASARAFRHVLEEAREAREWSQSGLDFSEAGIVSQAEGTRIVLYFSDIPFLASVYEFLCSMEMCRHSGFVNQALDDMVMEGFGTTDIRRPTAAFAKLMREYRKTHLDFAREESKFRALNAFLSDREKRGDWSAISDDDLLDFWRGQSLEGIFVEYATVFDAFHTYVSAVQQRDAENAAANAGGIGADYDSGELDVGETDVSGAEQRTDWQDPFETFDMGALAGIKFFRAASERKPFSRLMRYGPSALRWVRSYLRLESFGPEQLGITQYLRTGHGKRSLADRIACAQARDYAEQCAGLADLAVHIRRLQMASAHILGLGDDEQAPVFEKVYKGLRRAGFDGEISDDRRDLFFQAAEALVPMADLLQRGRDQIDRMAGTAPRLNAQFEEDRTTFSAQFELLYGDRT
jgi:hypothetical protein